MKIRTLAATLALALVGLSAQQVHAVIYDSSVPIPDEAVIIDFNDTGLDWVYAGPIGTAEWSASMIYAPSYRADEGWRFATEADWALRPEWSDFTRPGYTIPDANGGYTNHEVYRFASEYWGDFHHVDLNDAAAGRVTNGKDINYAPGYVYETWYVRDSRHASVPESTTTIGLLLGAMAGLACFRRRR